MRIRPQHNSKPSGAAAGRVGHRPGGVGNNHHGAGTAEALKAADELGCRIDVLYCGPDSDITALAFMRSLARVGCGECVVEDVVRAASGLRLVAAVKRLALPAPERKP